MSGKYIRCRPCRLDDHGIEVGTYAFCSCPCHIGDGSKDWSKKIEARARELRAAGASKDGGRLFVPPSRPKPKPVDQVRVISRPIPKPVAPLQGKVWRYDPYIEIRNTRAGRLTRELLERDGRRCHYCQRPFMGWATEDFKANPHAPTLDHKIPDSLGGSNQAWNLVLACGSCNTSRGTAPYMAFKREMDRVMATWPRDEHDVPAPVWRDGKPTKRTCPVTYVPDLNSLRVYLPSGRSYLVGC